MESLETKGKSSQSPTVIFRKTVNESLKSRDLPDLDEEEELEEDESQEIEEGIPVDVFDFCHELMEKGEVVSYEIYKHSTFMARKPHPYSWEKVQKDFGEGHYRVVAKSERTKKYIKQETRFVAKASVEETETTIAEKIQQAIPRESKKDPFEEMAKMATLMKSLTPQQAPDQTPAMMMQFMQSMMSMQQDAQKNTLEMIKEMQKSNQAMIEKLDRSQREAMDKIETKLSNNDNKKEGYDPLKILSLVQGAEKRGFENYLLLEELAEKKASKMQGGGGSDEEESATGKMIRTILPTVAAALSKQPQQSQPQYAAPRFAPKPQSRPMPQAPMKVSAPQAPAQVVAPPQAQVVKPKAPPQVIDAKANVVPTAKPLTPSSLVGGNRQTLPSKDKLLEAIMLPLGLQLAKADEVQLAPTKLNTTKVEAAQETLSIAKGMGVSPAQLLQMITKDDMLDIAKSVGLPIHANVWLKDYYAHLEQAATKTDQTSNQKPQNP